MATTTSRLTVGQPSLGKEPGPLNSTEPSTLESYLIEQASKRRQIHQVQTHVSGAGKVVIQIYPMGGDGSETLTFEVKGNVCSPGSE